MGLTYEESKLVFVILSCCITLNALCITVAGYFVRDQLKEIHNKLESKK